MTPSPSQTVQQPAPLTQAEFAARSKFGKPMKLKALKARQPKTEG